MYNAKRRPSLTMAHAGMRAGALGLLLALCLTLGAVPALADAPPGLQHAFYGTVTVGGTLAAEGTPVEAYVNNVWAAGTTVDAQGEYDLAVPGTAGAQVTFRVNGVLANETSVWQVGGIDELNLTTGVGPGRYQLQIAVSPAGSGIATDETSASPYLAGAPVNIKAVPAAGYRFLHWTATAGMFIDAAAAETIFTMPAQTVTVRANFRLEDTGNGVPVGGAANPISSLPILALWLALAAALIAGGTVLIRRHRAQC